MGGVKEIYINEIDNIEGQPTFDASTEKITAITISESKKFKTFQLRKQQAQFTVTPNGDEGTGVLVYNTNLTFPISSLQAATRLEFSEVAKGKLAVIVRDNNDRYWYLGYDNYVYFDAGGSSMVTGASFTDPSQVVYSLMDWSSRPPMEVESTIIAGIVDSNIAIPVPAGATPAPTE